MVVRTCFRAPRNTRLGFFELATVKCSLFCKFLWSGQVAREMIPTPHNQSKLRYPMSHSLQTKKKRMFRTPFAPNELAQRFAFTECVSRKLWGARVAKRQEYFSGFRNVFFKSRSAKSTGWLGYLRMFRIVCFCLHCHCKIRLSNYAIELYLASDSRHTTLY